MEKRITPILLGLSSKVHTHKHMYLQTFTLIQTGAVFKEPGGYNCKTAMWNIYNLWCIWCGDMYKLQRNFNKAQAIKKKLCEGLFSLFKELFLPKEKVAMRSLDSSNTTSFHWGKKKVISSFFQCLIDLGAGVLQRLFNGPTSDCSTMSNTVSKRKHFHWSMSLQSIQIKIDNGLQQILISIRA